MTDQERQVLSTLAKAHTLFASLPEQHPSDMGEWVQKIHDLQRIVMARVAERNHPDFFYQPTPPAPPPDREYRNFHCITPPPKL